MSSTPHIETAKEAARRLAASAIREGYLPEGLHLYTDADGRELYRRIRAKQPATGEKWVRPMRRSGGRYELGEPAFPTGKKPLYRLHEIAQANPARPVWFVEGEKCADRFAALSLLATTAGGVTSDEAADFEPLHNRTVILWPDNDKPGREHMQRVAVKLLSLECIVQILDIARLALPEKGDVVDYLTVHPNATASDLMALPCTAVTVKEAFTEAPPQDPPQTRADEPPCGEGPGTAHSGQAEPARAEPQPVAENGPAAESARQQANKDAVELIRGDAIKVEPVRWLWEGWLARGKLHIMAGAPGTGKTTLALAIAATVTSGGRWPDSSRAEVGAVLIWSGEDDPSDTLAPRLLAMAANMARVHFVGSVAAGEGRRPFDPATDMRALMARAAEIGDVRLLIVDPIVNAVAVDSHKNTEVRRALAPIVELASTLDCAALGISHFSKGTAGRDPVERVTGSLAFGALPRVVLATARIKEEDGTERRLLVRAKNNNGPDGAVSLIPLNWFRTAIMPGSRRPELPGVLRSKARRASCWPTPKRPMRRRPMPRTPRSGCARS